MRLRWSILALLLLGVLPASAHLDGPHGSLDTGGGSGSGGGALNVPEDADGDGSPDYVVVGDYDGDATLEAADISAAFAALTDTNRHVYVLPGNYVGPLSTAGLGTNAVIELNSYDTLECASPNTVTINANQWISGNDATAIDRAVVGLVSTSGNIGVTVKNCTFDGGYPSTWGFDFGDLSTTTENIDVEDERGNDIDPTYDDHGYVSGDGPFRLVDGGGGLPTCTPACAAATDYWVIRVDADTIRLASSRANALAGTPVDITAVGTGTNNKVGPDETAESLTYTGPMGWYGRGVQDMRLEGNVFRHTKHTCIYHSNFHGGLISGNQMDQCGAYNNAVAQAGVGVYLFANNTTSTTSEALLFVGNRISRAGNGYNLRSEDPFDGEVIQRIVFNDNYADRLSGACLTLWSARDVVADGLGCFDSTTLIVTDNAANANYMDQDATGVGTIDNVVQNVLVTNLFASGLVSASASAIQIGEYQDGLTMRNVKVNGASRNCLSVEQPVRGVLLEDIELKNCAQRGIRVQGTPRYKAEGVTIRGLTIVNTDVADPFAATDFNAILADGGLSFWEISDFRIIGGGSRSFDVVSISAANTDLVMRNGFIDCKEGRFRGYLTETGTGAADDYVCDSRTVGDWFITTNASSASDCTFASGTGTAQSSCFCTGSAFTAETLGSRDAIDISGALTDSEFTNIRAENCLNGYTLRLSDAAHDSVKIGGIVADQDPAFYDGTAGAIDPMHGAVSIGAGSTNVLVDGRTIQCNDVDATVANCMAGAEDDLAAGSIWLDDTCDAACTNGTTCIDTDAATGSLQQCESAAWNQLD